VTPISLQGMPDRPQIVKELPPIEAFLSKLERIAVSGSGNSKNFEGKQK